jgi:hypothetical protein
MCFEACVVISDFFGGLFVKRRVINEQGPICKFYFIIIFNSSRRRGFTISVSNDFQRRHGLPISVFNDSRRRRGNKCLLWMLSLETRVGKNTSLLTPLKGDAWKTCLQWLVIRDANLERFFTRLLLTLNKRLPYVVCAAWWIKNASNRDRSTCSRLQVCTKPAASTKSSIDCVLLD